MSEKGWKEISVRKESRKERKGLRNKDKKKYIPIEFQGAFPLV
jgi:hypothetical protein